MGAYPVVSLITFACYGGHLHGGISGSVDRRHNAPGTPILEADPARVAFEAELMDQAPYRLDQIRRDAVLGSIQEVCVHRGWSLLGGAMAAHDGCGSHSTSRRPCSTSSPNRVRR